MQIRFVGLGGPPTDIVRKAALEVNEMLPYEGVVQFDHDRRGLHPGILVSATESGIHFNAEMLVAHSRDASELDLILLTYEEVAHFILGKRGMTFPVDPLSDFLQEMFAAYVERVCVERNHPGRFEAADIIGVSSDPRSPTLHRDLGKMLGYEIAGDSRGRDEIDRWLAGSGANHPMQTILAGREHFLEAESAEELAEMVIGTWRQVKAMQGGVE